MSTHLLKILPPKHLIVITSIYRLKSQLHKFTVSEIKCHIICFLNLKGMKRKKDHIGNKSQYSWEKAACMAELPTRSGITAV